MAIILKPIVTEKMTAAGEKFNRYGFQVVRTANKVEIKKAVEELYNVQVLDVNTLICECLTNHKQFYAEKYPDIIIERSHIDDLITLTILGKQITASPSDTLKEVF